MRVRDKGYIPALTGLRGIAAWWVVVFHFSEPLAPVVPSWIYEIVMQGYLAVDLFFILSGYVIFTSSKYLRHSDWNHSTRFWTSRLIRIYPLHLILMIIYLVNPLVLVLFSSSGVVSERYDWDYFFASIFLVQNWGGFDELKWNIPAWSISAEFAAYLIAPFLIAKLISHLEKSQGLLLIGLVGGAFCCALLFATNNKSSIGDSIPAFGVARCLFEFWIGLCLGSICNSQKDRQKIDRKLITLAIISMIGVVAMLNHMNVPDYWYIPLAFTLLIYLLVLGDCIFSPVLASPFFHYLGVISYSTYLSHYLIKDWVKFLSDSIGLLQFAFYSFICLVASHCLYKMVEEPSRNFLKDKLLGNVR